jgi:hypothetical protein
MNLIYIIHIILHVLIPGIIAFNYYRNNFWKIWSLLMLSMLIDLDHLFTLPVFKLGRCSLGNFFLHSYIAIIIYFIFLFIPKLRIIGIGLLIHILIDLIDCIYIKIFYKS